jgi:hypothetical protein
LALTHQVLQMSDEIFTGLRALLAVHAAKFVVKRNEPDNYYLETVTKDGKPEMFAAVQIKKSYVSFHLFPVYIDPGLLADISPDLRKRMQGKSCFNFGPRHIIPDAELATLVQKCAEMSAAR